MPLIPGTSIGPYVIAEKIGAGGMGEVFRAQDVNLGRAAAIKVLPASLAGDPERLARFEREAQTLAALNHPNIAQVFGLEKGSGEFRAIAMEFVDGPTLADRIAGPMPLDDAIPIALQIAEALESAHDHGIVHRDLKPANIKVRPDGTVKVLDFGLAKAMLSATEGTSGAISNSPTITSPGVTHAGVILGTAAYMSPEQAKGRVVDRRADIWAFGCVLFEMLSGKRAFAGGDVSELIVSILRDDPPWDALPAGTPPHIKSLLQRCLQKDVRKRLPHIGVARIELTEPAAPVAATSFTDRATPLRYVTIATIVCALAVPAAYLLWSPRPAAPESPIRLRVELGTAQPTLLAGSMALSRDGRTVVFTGRPPTTTLRTALYVRHLDSYDAQPMVGTEAGQTPFFSPDGRWVAFFADGVLKKIAIDGGPVIAICPAPSSAGGWWGDDDAIVFASAAGLSRVPSAGGTPTPVPTATGHIAAFPQVLPRGRGILYSSSTTSDPAGGTVFVLVPGAGSPKEILQGGRYPRYVESGHLTFVRRGTLFAVPFDLTSLAAIGEPVPAVNEVFQAPVTAAPDLAIAANGTLAYQAGSASQLRQAPIMWMNQAGELTPLRATPAAFGFPRFSPDGTRLAMAISDGGNPDIWVYDWQRDVLTRITADPAADLAPTWTPDSNGLVFGSARDSKTNVMNLYWQRADGTGTAQRLTTSDAPQLPNSFDPSGRRLVYHEGNPVTNRQNIGMLTVEPGPGGALKAGTPEVLIGGPFLKSYPKISPDGKWMVYSAYDTGTFEIYVQPFPGLGNRVQVSSGGGGLAMWSRTKSELYYGGIGLSQMMVVRYAVKDGVFIPEKPRAWSAAKFSQSAPLAQYGPGFDLHPDGQRFAVAPLLSESSETTARTGQLVLFFNLFDELRRLAPVP